MDYKAIFTIQELQNYLSSATIVAFDFETAPDEKYRNEDKAALDAHNLAFESQFLYARGIVIQEPVYDTIAAAQLVYKNEKEFRSLGDCGLKTLVPEYFHEPLPSYAETVGG